MGGVQVTPNEDLCHQGALSPVQGSNVITIFLEFASSAASLRVSPHCAPGSPPWSQLVGGEQTQPRGSQSMLTRQGLKIPRAESSMSVLIIRISPIYQRRFPVSLKKLHVKSAPFPPLPSYLVVECYRSLSLGFSICSFLPVKSILQLDLVLSCD